MAQCSLHVAPSVRGPRLDDQEGGRDIIDWDPAYLNLGLRVLARSKDVLQANMVMTIEPGVFVKEEGIGVRLIDNCIIREDGIELLSTTPRDIAVVD